MQLDKLIDELAKLKPADQLKHLLQPVKKEIKDNEQAPKRVPN